MTKILQLSDTHLLADKKATLFGTNTYTMLTHLLASLAERIKEVDYIFLTGDVSQDFSEGSYQEIITLLEPFEKPIYWIAGNHDEKEIMERTLKRSAWFYKLDFLRVGEWGFFAIDTVQKDEDKGYVQSGSLQRNIPQSPYLACVMHHHPIPVGTPLIDAYKLQDAERLVPFFKQQRQPNLIITGHVHGTYEMQWDTIPVITSPATCLQFSKNTTTLTTDKIAGCTFWHFNGDGTFKHEAVFC